MFHVLLLGLEVVLAFLVQRGQIDPLGFSATVIF